MQEIKPINLFWEELEKKDIIKHKQTLLKNGFEEWDTIEELSDEILKQLSKLKRN